MARPPLHGGSLHPYALIRMPVIVLVPWRTPFPSLSRKVQLEVAVNVSPETDRVSRAIKVPAKCRWALRLREMTRSRKRFPPRLFHLPRPGDPVSVSGELVI